ncbi:MAG: stage II sporulation protein D [Oscillospiraceae bacterium]|nr:stage II sporulation protein D [Oscillospiraceae bacterium]
MKDLLKIAVIFGMLLSAIPLIVFVMPEKERKKDAENYSETLAVTSAEPETKVLSEAELSNDIIKVLDFTSGQVTELDMQDYVTGAVLAEMPASYHEEALKAQAVAARTYAVRQREKQRQTPDKLLMGADISNDSTRFQAYFTPEQAKAFYGDSYDTYYNIVYSAVEATHGEILVYGGEPIVAAFHSTSGGMTESAETVWGSAIEYLVPVDSAEDEKSPAYLDEKIFSEDELSSCITEAYPSADFSDTPEKWLVIGERSSSGTVIELSAGGEILSGTEFRQLFGLRSANFEIEYADGSFAITTKGNGHGVGMSQYGANTMANTGADYKEILLHYYTGTEICRDIY